MEQFQIEEAVNELCTVSDMVRWAVSRFNQSEVYFGHGTDNPWDEAIVLMMFGLNLPLNRFSEISHTRLTTSERRHFVDLVKRRIAERIPAAYMTNEGWFNGQPYYIDERVLVPRSPIGELIEARFEPWLDGNQPQRILDLCTGSGCIGIACAKEFEQAQVDLADISVDALAVAEINIQEHGVEERVIPIQSDLFGALEGQKYDLIVSNPPYVDEQDLSAMPEEYDHEPGIGLASGADGLDVTRQILNCAITHLNQDGVLVVEVGNSQAQLCQLFADVDFTWPTFERGGHGVFILTKAQLLQYQDTFSAACP